MLVSSLLFTARPAAVVVAAIRLMMTSWLISGLPRQFWLMNENSRCSILFHLLVPGGRWLTAMRKPVSSASFCSSTFQRRTREPLLLPATAEINRRLAFGYTAEAGGSKGSRVRLWKVELQKLADETGL